VLWGGQDDDRRRETSFHVKARMLEMDEPMAGAGAQLSGEHLKSETERASIVQPTSAFNPRGLNHKPVREERRASTDLV
jgi:hypothetical protein